MVTTPGAFRAHLARAVLRPASLWAIAGALVVTLIVAVFVAIEAALPILGPTIFFGLPLGMAPLAADQIARDRERGVEALLATTPSARTQVLLARLVGLLAVLGVSLLGATIVVYLLAHALGGVPPGLVLVHAAWGMVIGLFSATAGALVGYARGSTAQASLSAALAVVVVWLLLAVKRSTLLGLAGSTRELEILQAVVHASPLTWALEARRGGAFLLAGGHWSLMGGLSLVSAMLVLGLVAVALDRARTPGRPWRLRDGHVARLLLALSLVAAGVTLALWSYPTPGDPAMVAGSEDQLGIDPTERPDVPVVPLAAGGVLTLVASGVATWFPRRLNRW